MMKFPVKDEQTRVVSVGVVHGDQQTSRKCIVAVVHKYNHIRDLESSGKKKIMK